MKHLLTLSIFSFLILSCQPKDLPTISDIHADFAEVKFSHMTTMEELAKIKLLLKEMSNIYSSLSELNSRKLIIY